MRSSLCSITGVTAALTLGLLLTPVSPASASMLPVESVAAASTAHVGSMGDPKAATVLWGGTGNNDLGPATMLLSTRNGRVTVKNAQFVMACTDAETGEESSAAFWLTEGSATLRLNRFTMTVTGEAGGRDGTVRITGRLGSNGRGTARIEAVATGRDFETNAVIETCQAAVNYTLQRGR